MELCESHGVSGHVGAQPIRGDLMELRLAGSVREVRPSQGPVVEQTWDTQGHVGEGPGQGGFLSLGWGHSLYFNPKMLGLVVSVRSGLLVMTNNLDHSSSPTTATSDMGDCFQGVCDTLDKTAPQEDWKPSGSKCQAQVSEWKSGAGVG